MSSVDQSFLLDYIRDVAFAASRGADFPDLSVELLPDGRIVQFDGGYASEEELRVRHEAFHAAHPDFDYEDSMPVSSPRPAHKRKRRPSMADAARIAAREGVEIKLTLDGTMTVTPKATDKPESADNGLKAATVVARERIEQMRARRRG
jgi:hypothetical protein